MNYLNRTVSTRKKKHQHKQQLSQLNGILNDFVIGIDTNASATCNEASKTQRNSRANVFGKVTVGENSKNQDQFNENNLDDRVWGAVDNAVMTVKNLMQDAILTAMDNVITPRVQMAVKSNTE